MNDLDHLTSELPDPNGARRFLTALEEKHPREAKKLKKNEGLLSDVLTLAAYSPLLATTLLQNPDYLSWLDRKRRAPGVRSKEELLEGLGRFVLTHSSIDLHAQLARFRRRELLRIFLSDIRRLATMAEITEDISNLADAILETAYRNAKQEMDNRFGPPLVVDEKGKKTAAEFCIVSLGKLGSRELNYSSDIDLLFLYSADGNTSGAATRGAITNREYFIKLGERIVQIVGQHKGEGAAYRVDMRLRPHGRVGPLAISVDDAVRYYTGEARDWERQVLIRSRASAGDEGVFKEFFERVETSVFHANGLPDESQAASLSALEGVRRSKQMIDSDRKRENGFNVKLGRGGIREIEFIAQALQLAHGGSDRWLRAPHTLISLARLSDRGLITERELTELYNAYDFLRRLEHVLQMEHGLQTHTLTDDLEQRSLIARRMRCSTNNPFSAELEKHVGNVHRVFERIFGAGSNSVSTDDVTSEQAVSGAQVSPEPREEAAGSSSDISNPDQYLHQLTAAIDLESEFRHQIGAFRRSWAELIGNIKEAERGDKLDITSAKHAQTALAEACIELALKITTNELGRKYKSRVESLALAVLGLGKLGGGAIDYESDLDIVLVYDDTGDVPADTTPAEFYSRAAEIFVTALSSMTRDGSIYRVDLRLRPYGKNGQSVISADAFRDYMQQSAAIWEWLAYVKIRAVAGNVQLGRTVETDLRRIIHDRAASISRDLLAHETRRVRMLLEKERAGKPRAREIDIKYGTGGILDVYFAMRFLQLRDNIPDGSNDRSTASMLEMLHRRGSLTGAEYDVMLKGYRFLSMLDHYLRLIVGRTTRLPTANIKALDAIARRMKLMDHTELTGRLTLHRLNLRKAFDEIVR
jgi:[glutamine synthetase] adenylyltransferase / [glutamine synthetase]-adenylyl-L-tyrosine phosphorylase